MKRETMEWIRREAKSGANVDNPTQDERMAMDIDAELKRLRRKVRDLKSSTEWFFTNDCACNPDQDIMCHGHKLAQAALKKGGRK